MGRKVVYGGACAAAIAGAFAMPAMAADAQDASLAQQVEQLKAQVAQLQAGQSETWLSARRAEEVKSLVKEVLADADTRASLQDSPITAGHDGSKFFLGSTDGAYRLDVEGQIQVRYVYNQREDGDHDRAFAAGIDEHEYGFSLRRAKLKFGGHIWDPKIEYKAVLAAHRNTNSIDLEEVWVGYKFTDAVSAKAGRFKGPFLREELTSSSAQLAVERSLINEYFTTGYVEGLVLEADLGMVRLTGSFNDGAGSGEVGGPNDFHLDGVDYALTGRADVKLAGDWNQMKDFSAWEGEELGVFLGGAVHYQAGETGSAAISNDLIMFTVDGSVEVAGLNVYAAGIYSDSENNLNADYQDRGAVVQLGYMVIPDTLEPFVRYEYLHQDSRFGAVLDQDVSVYTVGVNYYLKKHAAKFTLDALYSPNTLSRSPVAAVAPVADVTAAPQTGLGILGDVAGEENQFVVRGQVQVLF